MNQDVTEGSENTVEKLWLMAIHNKSSHEEKSYSLQGTDLKEYLFFCLFFSENNI